MKTTKIFAIVLTVFLTLLVSSTGYGIPLDENVHDQVNPSNERSTSSATIPYTGNLTNEEGNPVTDGIYTFKFNLYEDQTNDEPLWSEEQQEVKVESGVFNVQLGMIEPLPAQALQRDNLLLQVSVRAVGDEKFTTLNPPQVLQPVSASNPESANAQAACAHDHLGEEWIFNGSTEGLTIENNSAAALYGKNTDSYGVRGESDSHIGVYGKSNSSFGIRGDSDTTVGVWGKSNSGSGVTGASVSHIGVKGESEEYYGGYFTSDNEAYDIALGGAIGRINARDGGNSQLYLSSNADLILKLDNDGGENNVLRVQNSGGNDVCTIDEDGNLWCAGTITSVISSTQESSGLLTSNDIPEVLFEDFGTGTLENGESLIEFEQIFAETVNLGENYYVFLTPVCDQPLVLSVSSKTTSGFSVQGVTLDGSPSNCTFDYRIVAKRLDYESLRLEQVSTDLEETP